MRVEYDPVKAIANLRKHGVSLADAAGVLDVLPIDFRAPCDAQGANRL
jgi:uncharacterized DUF497 family protein